MTQTKYLPATKIYNIYSIPRSMLRQLTENGTVRCIEKDTGGDNVFKIYSVEDIERFLNEK